MAYLIFNSENNLVKIAANDSDRDSQNLILSNHSVVTISDSDFLKIRTGTAIVSYDGTNVNITNFDDNNIENENDLKSILKDITSCISSFLNENEDNSLYSSLNEYRNYLLNFDTSSLTFPLNKSWEQYCNENSITFYHPLQIP